MTKFLSKLFLCGILLSSVNGYCQEQGVLITAMGGVPISISENLTIDNSEFNIGKDYETHYDIVIGAFIDGLSYSTEAKTINSKDYAIGEVITATNFQYATATTDSDGNTTWEETCGSDTVIPIRNAVGYYYLNSGQNKIYKVTDATKTNDADYTSGAVYQKVSEKWQDADGNDVTIKVIDLKTAGTGFTSDADDNILFNGNVAYKNSGTWKLLPNDHSLAPAVLKVAAGKKLTIGDKQTGSPLANSESAELKVTPLGSIEGPATIELLNDGFTTGDSPTQNQWETSVVLEPGSVVGNSDTSKKVSISKGTVDLSGYITLNTTGNTPVFNTTEAGKLHLTLDSTVNLFDQYIASNATASDKNNLITNFNGATIPSTPLFNDVTSVASTGKITVGVPYVLTDGTNYYNAVNSIASSYLTDITAADTTLELLHIDKSKISVLFKSGATINYNIDAKNILKDLISTLKGQNANLGEGETQKTITIKAAAFKDLDSSIDFENGDFKGDDDNAKKFKIVIEQSESGAAGGEETDPEAGGGDETDPGAGGESGEETDTEEPVIAVDGAGQPAATYHAEDKSSENGNVTFEYKNLANNSTIVLNSANNACNAGKGPDTTISNSTAKIALTGDTNMKSLTITGTSDIVINGKGQKLQVGTLSTNKDSKVKVVGTKFTIC